MDTHAAVDLYVGAMARERWQSPSTQATNRRLLTQFADSLHGLCVHEIELRHYERWLNRWVGKSPTTMANGVSLVRGFSAFLHERGWTHEDVARPLRRPRKLRPDDLPVLTIGTEDVRAMLGACESWQELLCIATAAFLGSRRAALARIRRSDVDLVRGTARFVEKGGKEIVKRIPDEYKKLLVVAERDGLWQSGEDYLIPNRRPNAVRRKERSDKVVWNTVKLVAARAGVRAHVHALRAAFAVAFHEAHPGQTVALQDLLGHARPETTIVYLRRRNKQKGMEVVADLSWGLDVFSSQNSEPSDLQEKAHTGFEPVLSFSALRERIGRELAAARGDE